MNINEFLTHVNQGKPVSSKSEIHKFMVKLSNEAMRITSELNFIIMNQKKSIVYFLS